MVIININDRRSDAIIVLSRDNPVVVPLHSATPYTVRFLIESLGPHPCQLGPRKAIMILRDIWDIIMAPITAQLPSAIGPLSTKPRIWLCPVGIASKLPLHAAGPYKRGAKNLAHLFTVSYTTSLGSLIRAQESTTAVPATETSDKRLLVIEQPGAPNESPLPDVDRETEAIQHVAPHAVVLKSPQSTKEAVLKELRECNWLHFACQCCPTRS